MSVEAHNECLVEADSQRVLQETRGRALLEIKPAVYRPADIDQQTHMQRQIGFATEIENRLRRLVVVKNAEIILIQIADKLAMLVGRDEQHVNLVHPRV